MKKAFFTTLLLGASLLTTSLAQSPDRRPLIEADGPSNGNRVATDLNERNLFAGAKASANGFFGKDKPELAIDGQINPDKYWGNEGIPSWFMVDMGKPQTLSSIHIWTFWADGRIYKYKIEGSKDARTWKTLVDQSANSISGTKDGNAYTFNPAEIRYVRTTFLDNSRGKASGGHIVEIKGFAKPEETTLNACVVPSTRRTPKHGAPEKESAKKKTIVETAWRGERVNAQVALWSDKTLSQLSLQAKPLKGPGGASIPVEASFVKFTLGGGKLYADIIAPEMTRTDIPGGTTRTAWLQINVPEKAAPGIYKGELLAKATDTPAVNIPIAIKVLPTSISAPKNWKIHLDIWQHPHAVARIHKVTPWSPEHFALMKPLMRLLADAGQKTITCSIIEEAWGGQTFDLWPSMIEWSMKPDGTMVYDYTNFDKWVSFMMNDIGIPGHITCYTMIPWSNKLRYMDLATGDYKYADIIAGKPEYEKIWGAFLSNFRKHAKSKGWINKICIGIDERPDHAVRTAVSIIKKYAPEFKICSAINSPSQTNAEMYDISPQLTHSNTVMGDILTKRKAEGKKTTFYVCVNPKKPNTFTASPLAESEWLGLFAAANNLDGFLRWAYNSWGRDPEINTDFGNWPAGDCFLVYPGAKSSLRFEKMRDGLESFEKITILRNMAKKKKASPALKKAVANMDETLKQRFTIERSQGNEHEADVQKANEAILKASMEVR